MKILHISETLKGGIASYLSDLIPIQSEIQSSSIALLVPDSHLSELKGIKAESITTFRARRNRIISSMVLLLSAIKLIYSMKPDVVHLHSTFAGCVLRIPLRLLFRNVSIIYCSHGWAFDRPMGKRAKFLVTSIERFLAGFCHKIICISGHDYAQALGIGIKPGKLIQINNGILNATSTANEEPQWPAAKLKILYVGRFDKQKGVDILFDVLEQLGDDYFAYIIGDYVLADGPRLKAPENCRQLGWLPRDQIDAYYASADVLVIPSRWEGFGLIAVEAMRSGLAVVASNVGGLREIVLDGITGILIPPANAEVLVNSLKMTDAEDFRRMGENGRARFIENYCIDRVADKLNDVYVSFRH